MLLTFRRDKITDHCTETCTVVRNNQVKTGVPLVNTLFVPYKSSIFSHDEMVTKEPGIKARAGNNQTL